MANPKEIKIYPIASTTLDRPMIRRWLEENHVFTDGLIRGCSDSEILVGLAAKRCYRSFALGLNPNITQIREDWGVYLENILKQGHGSVLEHASWTFAIENVTRVFTGEMNRHRAGWAISEGSMRYIRFDDIPYWLPPSIQSDTNEKCIKTREVFQEVFEYIQEKYAELVKIWNLDKEGFNEKKIITSMLRRIIPMGVCTGGIWSGNLRALRHVITMRCSPAAEEEIRYVFTQIGTRMLQDCGLLFGDFDPYTMIPKWVKV